MGGGYPGQEEADTEKFMPVMTELEPLYNSMEVCIVFMLLILSLRWTHF